MSEVLDSPFVQELLVRIEEQADDIDKKYRIITTDPQLNNLMILYLTLQLNKRCYGDSKRLDTTINDVKLRICNQLLKDSEKIII